MISKRLLLLILCLAVTSCTMDCVEPGLQSRNISVNVDVPVHKADEGVKIHWVDSGQIISKDEEIQFNLNGSINFCPLEKEKDPRKVLVPAVFCANGSEPEYSSELINNSGLDEHKVCKNVGFGGDKSHSKRRYVDTGIKVNPGDKLSFSLVSREMIIDYDNPGRKGISFDDNCYIAEKGDEKATIKDMLNGGTFYCGDNSKRTTVKFPQLSKENMEKRRVLVGNGYTPYDNKVHFNKGYIQDNKTWRYGSLLDLRRAKIGLNELCDGKNCDFNEVKKYSSYELNCYYQNVCYTEKGIWNYGLGQAGERNCVSSIRYEKYDKGNTCDMYSYLKKIEENVKAGGFTEDDKSWAEALVAKIGDLDDQDTAKGIQCLPKKEGAKGDNMCSQIGNNNKYEDFSL